MAVAAGGGLQVSGSERGPVNAPFIAGDESGGVANLPPNIGVFQMALQAQPGLSGSEYGRCLAL